MCTPTSDRVCANCVPCATGTFLISSCSPVSNNICKTCSVCTFGKYVSQTCTDTADTGCSSCTLCTPLQYELQGCELGQNTQCASCRKCTFSSPAAELKCSNGPLLSWQLENCCFDSAGNNIPCGRVDIANMYQAAVAGKHPWLMPGTTTPKIVGFPPP